MFEEYFKELLSTYLDDSDYENIPENNKTPRADWRINLCGYKFILEQKSTILRLDAKQQSSNYNSMNKYMQRTVIKALKQLKSTEDELVGGSLTTTADMANNDLHDGYIKIVLLLFFSMMTF